MKTDYNNYFKTHLGYSYSKKDVLGFGKWFYAQDKVIREKVKLGKNDKILEIGSGIGGFFQFINDGILDYRGIELDKKAVDFSNRNFNTKKFFNVSLDNFKQKNFNRIFAFEVLEHFEDPIESIEKIYSILGKGGIFCGTSPYPFAKNILADETHIYVLNPENWKRLFLQAGFKKVELYPMSFLPVVWRINKRLNITIPMYIPFKYFISTCLIVAHK